MTRYGTLIIGVDPGGAHTGLVARHGPALLEHHTIDRRRGQPLRDYLDDILDDLEELTAAAKLEADEVPVAVEAVVAPSGHARDRSGHIIAPAGIVDTAVVYGAILGRYPAAVDIPPDGNGQQPLALYPAELRPARGSGKGHDNLRHARSAWDVAGLAALVLRSRRARTR